MKYTFKNNKTLEIYTLDMKMSEREDYLNNNPDVEQLIVSAPSYIGAGRLDGVMKPDRNFNNLLNQIKKNNHGSTIQTGGGVSEI